MFVKKIMIAWLTMTIGSFYSLSAMTAMNDTERKVLFDKGVSLYNQKQYAESAEVFRELQRDKLVPEYYFNIGECEYLRKRFDLAKESFDLYLELLGEDANPERKAYIEKILEKITPVLGELEVDEAPPFEVYVDDEYRTSSATKNPIVVMIGEHTIVLKKDGKTVFNAKVKVDSQEPTVLKIEETESEESDVAPAEKQTAIEPTESHQPEKTSHRTKSKGLLKPVGLGMAITGGVLVITSVITGSVVLSKANLLEEKCTDKKGCSESEKDLYDSGHRLGIATTIILPIGCVLAATGAVLALVGHRREKRNESLTQPSLRLAPFTVRNGAGLSFSGSF